MYSVDMTPGQSGGPIWRYNPDLGNAAVGIMTHYYTDGRVDPNGAHHIGQSTYADFSFWRTWNP